MRKKKGVGKAMEVRKALLGDQGCKDREYRELERGWIINRRNSNGTGARSGFAGQI